MIRRSTTLCMIGLVALSGCDGDDSGASHADDLVNVTPSISGTVAASVGGSRLVALSFTPTSGELTKLEVTSGLTPLPAGWTGPATFVCPTVNAGSSCVLNLTFTPAAATTGMIAIWYRYTNAAGVSRSNTISVPYSSTTANNVVATAAPTGTVQAIVGGGARAVNFTFTTDDGNPASALNVTTNLASLPTGWSSQSTSFTCASVSTGNGCQLSLMYAPSSAGSGTLNLAYAYSDNSGASKTGSTAAVYAATAQNNAVATASPSGQVAVAVGGAQAVTVTFTSDDGNSISNLSITNGLATLPAGWSSGANTFACVTAATGNACQLTLTNTPATAGNGTVALQYSYTNNSGAAKSGTVSIPYVSTTHNNVAGTVAPSGTIATQAGDSTNVSVTFNSDDGNPATSFAITSNLASLPSGWGSVAHSFNCASVSSGNGCKLDLSFTPLAAANSTLMLNFDYADNSGSAKTGSVSIPYAATSSHAYISDYDLGLFVCTVQADGSLSACTVTGNGFDGVAGIAFSGNYAYVTSLNSNSISVCTVAADGTLSSCTYTGSGFSFPGGISASGGYLYVQNAGGAYLNYCAIGTDGSLSNCASTAAPTGITGITVNGTRAYLSGAASGVYKCDVAVDGSLSSCALTGSGFNIARNVTISGGRAYVADESVGVTTCAVGADGSFSNCVTTFIDTNFDVTGVAIRGGYAYVDGAVNNCGGNIGAVYQCALNSSGNLSNCITSNGGATFSSPMHLLIR